MGIVAPNTQELQFGDAPSGLPTYVDEAGTTRTIPQNQYVLLPGNVIPENHVAVAFDVARVLHQTSRTIMVSTNGRYGGFVHVSDDGQTVRNITMLKGWGYSFSAWRWRYTPEQVRAFAERRARLGSGNSRAPF